MIFLDEWKLEGTDDKESEADCPEEDGDLGVLAVEVGGWGFGIGQVVVGLELGFADEGCGLCHVIYIFTV